MSKKRRKLKPTATVDSAPLAPAPLVARSPALRAPTMDGFDNFINRAGLNNDNALSASHYTRDLTTRRRLELDNAYRSSWIVGAVIDSIPEDMTRAGVDITTHEAENEIKDLQAHLAQLQIWQSLASFLKWSRLYGGCIAVLQIEGQDTETPLKLEAVSRDQFKGLAVYDRWSLQPDLTRLIQSGSEMGLPEFYTIQTPEALNTAAGDVDPLQYKDPHRHSGILIHHSRVVRGIGNELPRSQAITESLWGQSVLERLWDRLVAFDNATMSSASLIDMANLRTVRIDGLRDVVSSGGDALNGLVAQFDMMRLAQSNQGLTLLDKNDEFQTTAYSFGGLSDLILQFGQQLSGASGIPLVRLFGQSPAGLSATGEGDMRVYYDNINAKQNASLRQPFAKILQVAYRSKFGVAPPADLEFTFTPLWQMSKTEKAQNAKTTADTILEVFEGGLIPKDVAMTELRAQSRDSGLFGSITDEMIAEAEGEADELELAAQAAQQDPQGEAGALDPSANEPLDTGRPNLQLVRDAYMGLPKWLKSK